LREAEKQLKVVIDQLEAWDRAVAKMNATSINKGVGAITDAIDPVKTAESEQIPAPIQLKDRNLKSGVSTGVISAAEAKIEQKFRDAGLDGPTQELSVQDAEKLKQMEARIERKYQSLFRRQKSDRIQPPGKVQLNYTPETQAIVGEIETEQKFREFEARAYASDQLGGKEQNHSDGWVRRKTRAIQRRLGMKPSEIKDQEVESRFQQIELEAAAKVSTPQNDQNPDSVVAQLDQQVADQQAKKNASKLKKLEAKIAKRSKKIAKTNKDNQIELSDRIKRLMLVYDPDSEFDTIRGGPPTGPNDPNNPANTGRQKMRLQNIQAQLAAEPPKPTSKIPAIFQGVAAAGLVALAAPKIIDFTRQQGAAAMNEYIDANKQQTAMSYALGGATRGQQAYGYAKGVAKDLGIDQKSSIRGYSQLATATKGTSLEGQGAADLFEGLSSASTVLGLSADDTSGAMNALVQMMSKGKVQAEELRGQLGERIPGAFSLFAKAIGVSEAQLNKMMERGEVIASATLPKFAAELKRTFGPDAANASQNMQSSMFRLQGQFQDLQVATMSAIAPALNEGISLVTSSMQILTAILPQLLSLLGAIGIALVSKIAVGAVAAAGGIKAIAEASLEIGKKALPSLVSMGAQMIAITAAIEVLKNIWAGFGSSELGKGFEQAGERAIATLERVKGKAIETKDAVGKALGEDPNNGFKPQDMVDSVISSGNNFAKSMRDTYGSTFDNAGKVLNNASPVAFIGTQARQGLGIEDRETGRIKLSSERQFDNDLRLANEGANANALSVGGASPARYKEALQAAATIDAQISPLTDRRAFLTGLKKPSEDQKAELKKVNEEFNRLSKEQTTAGSKAENEYNLAAGAKKAAEDQIAQINADKTLSDENKKKLLKPWEDVLKISTPVVARMDEIRSAVNTAANAGTNLAGAFADVADAIDEAQRAAARFAAVEGLKTTKAELKGQFTDSLVGQRTAVSRAQTDVKAADMLAAAGAEGLKAQEAAVNTNAVKSKLASIPTANNVPLTLDASLKDIESAKKGLGQGAADAEKRDLLDSLKSFKEAKDKQVELENNAQQARIKVIQATEALTLASIDREAGRRELATRRIEAKEAAKVGGRDMTIKAKLARKDANYDQQDANVDLTQNAIARAQLQARSVDRQEAETKRQLQDLEKNKGKITAAEFERRKIGLESTLIDLGGKKQDAQAGIQDAKIAAVDAANNRILDRQQFANRQAASKIETSKSEGSIAIQRGTLASLTGGQRLDQEQADLANIGVNANANKAERAQIEAEIQQVKGNEKAKIITRRESVEQQIALQQRLTSSVAAGLDLEIQRQQKLRDIAMRAIQDRIDASERASRVAQSGLQRELEMAVNYAQKRLELQEQLISSQAELSQSRFALTQTQGEGSIKQADEALSLRKKIDEKDANPLVKEAAQRQLRQLGFSSSSTEADIIATKDSREATLARSKMDALLREESIQSRLLEFEMKKLEFASRSAEIEAKKAELLAKQAENAANLKLELANAMAPGKERDRAIAEAKAEKTMATDGIAIAAEQAKLAKEQAALIPQLKADKQERIALDSQKAKLELGQQEGERRRARELEYAGAKGATGPLGGIVNDFAIAASPASIATQKSAMMGTAFADKGGLTQAQAIAALGSAELQRKLFGNDVVQTRGSLGKLNQDYGPRGGALSQPQAQDVLGSQALQRDVFGESAIKAQATNTEALGKLTEAIKAIPVPARTDSLPRRASGGPGIGGQSYLVGELGPEVFTAPFDGRFLPNSAITPIPSAPPAQSLNSAGPAVPELASTMKDLAREIKGLAASAVAAARVPRSLTVQGVEEPAKAAASIWAENASDRITNAGL
jgi:tape measure domain-containing protein